MSLPRPHLRIVAANTFQDDATVPGSMRALEGRAAPERTETAQRSLPAVHPIQEEEQISAARRSPRERAFASPQLANINPKHSPIERRKPSTVFAERIDDMALLRPLPPTGTDIRARLARVRAAVDAAATSGTKALAQHVGAVRNTAKSNTRMMLARAGTALAPAITDAGKVLRRAGAPLAATFADGKLRASVRNAVGYLQSVLLLPRSCIAAVGFTAGAVAGSMLARMLGMLM